MAQHRWLHYIYALLEEKRTGQKTRKMHFFYASEGHILPRYWWSGDSREDDP